MPNHHNKGGSSAPRFGRIRANARHAHLTQTLEHARRVFVSTTDPNKLNVKGLILGGPGDIKQELAKMLEGPLLAGFVASVSTSVGGEAGLGEAVINSRPLLEGSHLAHQRTVLKRFLEKLETCAEDTAYGVDHTLRALSNNAVDILFVWEKLPLSFRAPTATATPWQAHSEKKLCEPHSSSDVAQLGLVRVVDWLRDHEKQLKVAVVLVSDQTPEGTQFCHGFGGMGALLRFPFNLEDFDDHSLQVEAKVEISHNQNENIEKEKTEMRKENPSKIEEGENDRDYNSPEFCDEDLYGDIWDLDANQEESLLLGFQHEFRD